MKALSVLRSSLPAAAEEEGEGYKISLSRTTSAPLSAKSNRGDFPRFPARKKKERAARSQKMFFSFQRQKLLLMLLPFPPSPLSSGILRAFYFEPPPPPPPATLHFPVKKGERDGRRAKMQFAGHKKVFPSSPSLVCPSVQLTIPPPPPSLLSRANTHKIPHSEKKEENEKI